MSGKVKTRFTTLDVTAMVTELRSKLIGMRVNNIYDLNTKTYVFKMARTEQKEFLVFESGVRFHTTSLSAEKNKIPTPFTMKLRKYLREKRLESIEQIGVERVVDFTFGKDDNAYHIILELYASGNFILTDGDYKILALLRSHVFTETVKTAVGEVYPFEQAANLKLENFRTDTEYIDQLINQDPIQAKEAEGENAREEREKGEKEEKGKKDNQKGQKEEKENKDGKQNKEKEKGKKNVKKLKDVLFRLLPCYHQALIDQLLKDKNLSPNTKASNEHINILQEIANESIEFLKAFSQQKQIGYLIYKTIKQEEDTQDKENKEVKFNLENGQNGKQEGNQTQEGEKPQDFIKYLEFSPIPVKTTESVKELESFDKAVDEFFTKQQFPDVQKGKEDKKKIAWKKYENIKRDQEIRMEKLKAEQEACLEKAFLIESNLQVVDAIINIVGAMVQAGIGWDKIWKMINESKNNGDPFASMISRLKLENDQVVILLKNPEDSEGNFKEVEADIRIKAFINAERYYQEKKKLEIKDRKTFEASQQALKLAERAAMNEVNHEKQRSHLLITRKTYWFEKFYWFVTSENYLVISGRDAQQNELLVKRYLKKGDIYMHADIHGAGSVIVKNPTLKPLPKTTLDEAAIFTVCRSKAWESKIITSAWWVYDHQVSKTAPSGEFLPTGSFMVRGKKNFLNPSRLEMGFGLLFKIDESSLSRHENDRKVKFDEAESPALPELTNQLSEQDNETFYITGQEYKPIIMPYDKKQQQQGNKGKQQLVKEKSVIQEEKKRVVDEDEEDDEEDEFSQVRRTNSKADSESKRSDAGKGDLKNLQKVPRGKKAKIQKMKEKYGDQDEEEKELRMKLTGAKEIKELREDSSDEDVRKGKKKDKGRDKDRDKDKNKDKGKSAKGGKQQDQSNKQKQQQQPQNKKPAQNQPQSQPQNKKQGTAPNKQVPERVEKVEVQSSGKTEIETPKSEEQTKVQPKTVVPQQAHNEVTQQPVVENKEGSSKEELEERKLSDGDKDEELNEITYSKGDIEDVKEGEQGVAGSELDVTQEGGPENQSELDELKMLISNPHPEDTLLFAVPICAPYVTLNNYKYKSKLVPGTLKKGKAVKTVMSVFLSQKELSDVEKKLMKTMGEAELVNSMIGNVKIGAAGLLKVKEKEKKAKDQKKKEIRNQEKKK